MAIMSRSSIAQISKRRYSKFSWSIYTSISCQADFFVFTFAFGRWDVYMWSNFYLSWVSLYWYSSSTLWCPRDLNCVPRQLSMRPKTRSETMKNCLPIKYTIQLESWLIHRSRTQASQIFTWANPRSTKIISAFFLPQVEQDMQSNMDNLKDILEK
jgi:hypothetical protein